MRLEKGKHYLIVSSFMAEEKADELRRKIEHYSGAHIVDIVKADSIGLHFIEVDSPEAVIV